MNAIREMMAEENGYQQKGMSGLLVGIGWLVIWTALLLSHAMVIMV